MAALIAAAAEPSAEIPFVSFESEGVILIYGRDEAAIEAANLLKDHLDVTVLIRPPADIAPPRITEFPVVKGTIRSAKGYLGAFELTVDDYAQPAPSSRGALSFGPAKNGATSRCDIILDISGGAPLFSAADLRDGYLRADPGDPAAVMKAVLKARDLVGTFDKPRYIDFTADICAHSRSKIVGCNRCLDLCPTGAIAPAGDHVAIDAHICAGCGQCAAVCPTGAASYALPPADALMRKLRTLLTTYRDAGGTKPGHPVPRRRPRHAADRRAGALRRRAAGERAAGRGQRGDAGRARDARRGVRLWRRGGAAAAARQAAPRRDRPAPHAGAGRADPRRARLRRRPRRADRDRRSRCARRGAARDRAAGRRAAAGELPADRRQARRDAARLARAAPRRAGAGRRRAAAGGRAVRQGRAQCRGLHALPRLRVGLPDRRARRRSRRSRRCASPRTPACNAGCARRPARRRSSR